MIAPDSTVSASADYLIEGQSQRRRGIMPVLTYQQPDTRSGSQGLLMTMCLAVLLVQVDTSVVNLATRAIGEALHAGVMGLQWVLDAYNVAYAAMLLTGGLLADLYGRRRLF